MTPQNEDGERVLAHAVKLAQDAWGNDLAAAYAIGSLAHGGFSVHASDVDIGFVLNRPLVAEDAHTVARLSSEVKGRAAPLANRLSVFWGSLDTLSGAAVGGRFPPTDLIDLKKFGRLLAGNDIRSKVRAPTLKELTVASAAFALKSQLLGEATAHFENPAGLASADIKKLTKTVLYPVRFLYTARTGQTGINHEAVEHFLALQTGPAADVARSAYEWRMHSPAPGDASVVLALQNGLRPLYRVFIDDYEQRLRGYGEVQLAQTYSEWRQRVR